MATVLSVVGDLPSSGTANWPYVVLVAVVVLFGANGAVMAWMKSRADTITSLNKKIDNMQELITSYSSQVGKLEGQVTLLNTQLDTVRKDNATKHRLVARYRAKYRRVLRRLTKLQKDFENVEHRCADCEKLLDKDHPNRG